MPRNDGILLDFRSFCVAEFRSDRRVVWGDMEPSLIGQATQPIMTRRCRGCKEEAVVAVAGGKSEPSERRCSWPTCGATSMHACKNAHGRPSLHKPSHHHADQVRVQVGSGEGPGLPPRPALGGGLAAQWRHPAVSIIFGVVLVVSRWFLACIGLVVGLHVGSGTVSTCGRRRSGYGAKVRAVELLWLGCERPSGIRRWLCCRCLTAREVTSCRDLYLWDLWHILCRPQHKPPMSNTRKGRRRMTLTK